MLRVNPLIGFGARKAAAGGGGGDPFFANVVLLVSFDGTDGATTATDDSNSGHTLTFNGNAQLDTGVAPPFGTASLLSDGSGDYVSIPDSSDWHMTGDATWEWFAWLPVVNQLFQNFLTQSGASGNFSWRFATVFQDLQIRLSTDGTTEQTPSSTGNAILATTWQHYCVEREGSKFRIYIDGVMVGSSTALGAVALFDSNASLGIGAMASGTPGDDSIAANIKEVRITKGVARYASDAGFTPPTAAFPRS